MKFKTKEDLKLKKNIPVGEIDDFCHGMRFGVAVSFKSFAERVEFYKKYKDDDLHQFIIDYPEKSKKESIKGISIINLEIRQAIGYFYWNDWLFDYCFGDIK